MRAYAEAYKVLSDETRLVILALLLAYGELCVCDVEAALGITQSKASRHLRYLKNAGLLEDRRSGIWVYYRLSKGTNTEATRVVSTNRKLLSTLLDKETNSRLKKWLISKSKNASSCPTLTK